MTPDIWQDIAIRLNNLRGDMVGQWQGDLNDHRVEQAVTMLGLAIQQWDAANPSPPSPFPVGGIGTAGLSDAGSTPP